MPIKILFLVNPNAGDKSKDHIAKQIEKIIDKKKIEYSIIETKDKKDTISRTQEAIKDKLDGVVAVGGDGTVNDIATLLVGSGTALCILPTGSGNGLARHLKISLDVSKALESINNFKTQQLDAVKIGDKYIFNVGGVGFDAHTGATFNTYKGRGLKNYTKAALNVLGKYKPIRYLIHIKGISYSGDAFMICIANASQFGYNASINPSAKTGDGKFEVCFLRPFPKFKIPELILRLFNGKIDKFSYWESVSCQSAEIEYLSDYLMHYDGEIGSIEPKCKISICADALNVVC